MKAGVQSALSFPAGLDSPAAIQGFLDEIPYSTETLYRCPARVLRDRKAHCYDGALLAAAALRRLGFPPRIVELLPEPRRDDDHILAVYQLEGRWGALGKSNFVGLRLREPVYRDLRELVMTYFEHYYNTAREKTLRGYTVPLSLAPFDPLSWETRDEAMEVIAQRLDQLRRFSILTPAIAERLSLLDVRSYEAGLSGALKEGLYRPR